MFAGQAQDHELQRADPPHQLRDRSQSDGPGGVRGQLVMHGRQGRKDRGDLARHAARPGAGRIEEELSTLARIADAAQQVFEAVHGGTSYAPGPAAPSNCCARRL